MANNVGTRPMILDTVTTPMAFPSWVKIGAIQFDEYDSDTDTATLVDINGNTVWEANGKGDLSPVHLTSLQWVHGLRLSQITAGVIRVYVQ